MRSVNYMIMIYITENYKTEGRPMATFSFLKEINNENSGEFLRDVGREHPEFTT